MKRLLLCVTSGLLLLTPVTQVLAHGHITIVNLDGPNEGFNDPTPVAPVGGNPGTTIGQQRLNCFNYAANIWACTLDSDVDMRIGAQFNPLSCTSTSGTLGSTGPSQIWRDFAGAPVANTWFVDAEADARTGTDLNPAGRDMTASFNSNLGTVGCLDTSPWYYGLDNNEPAGAVELVVVLIHEFSHGLGFLSTANVNNGSFPSNIPDIFSRQLRDNTLGLHWDAMTNAQRATSTINTNNLVWDAPAVTAQVPARMCQASELHILSPPVIAGTKFAPLAAFSACNPNVTAPVVDVVDGTAPTTDGCEAITNDLTGKIALIDRGLCTFVVKVQQAMAAGAIGVIVVNNSAATPIEMGGDVPGSVPAVMVSQSDGNAIRAQLGVGVTANIGTNPARFAGADAAGRLLMYAPNPRQSGSSVSHWDTSARPNLSMEPAINADLSYGQDFTIEAFQDIFWTFNAAPTAICQNIMVTGSGGANCTADVQASDVNNGSFDPNGDTITMTLTPAGPYPAGPNAVHFTVSDGCRTSSCDATITVECPVAVNLAAFSIAWQADGALLKWEVASATDHSGFRVYRQDTGSERREISDRLLTGDSKFEFVDAHAPAAGADYYLADVSRTGVVGWHGPLHLNPAAASVPLLMLAHAQPNPFSQSTSISFSLPGSRMTSVTIHDAQGRLIRRLFDGVESMGAHDIVWDGRDASGVKAPGGLYFVKLQAGTESRLQKVLLNR